MGCEWELGQNDLVQYDSALSPISPFPSPLTKLPLTHKHTHSIKTSKASISYI